MTKQEFLENVLGKECMTNFYNKEYWDWDWDYYYKAMGFLEFEGSIQSFFDNHKDSSTVFFAFCCKSEWFRSTKYFSKENIAALHLKDPDNALMYALDYLTKEQIIECSKLSPFRGLCLASNILPKDVVNEIAVKSPETALNYCPELLDNKTFDFCAMEKPSYALGFGAKNGKNANKFLTPDQIKYCARKSPRAALEFSLDLLDDETFEFCVNERPYTAYIFAKDRLSKKQLDFCKYEMKYSKVHLDWIPILTNDDLIKGKENTTLYDFSIGFIKPSVIEEFKGKKKKYLSYCDGKETTTFDLKDYYKHV